MGCKRNPKNSEDKRKIDFITRGADQPEGPVCLLAAQPARTLRFRRSPVLPAARQEAEIMIVCAARDWMTHGKRADL